MAAAAAEAVLHLAAQTHSVLVLIVAEACRIQLRWRLSCDSRKQEWESTALDIMLCCGSTISWGCNHHKVLAVVSVLLPGRWCLV